MDKFVEKNRDAYRGRALLAVPVIEVKISRIPHNPDPDLFMRSRDGQRWVNKNPDPAWYTYKKASGGIYLRRKKRATTAQQAAEEKKEPKGWIVSNAKSLRDAAWRIDNLGVALPKIKIGKTTIRLRKLGKRAKVIVSLFRIRDGLLSIRAGIKEEDGYKKIAGLKELSLGMSIVVPLLAPLGLGLWVLLSMWDFFKAVDKPELEGELKGLGWAGAAAGWLLPYLSKGATAKALGRVFGVTGAGLLTLKDLSNVLEGYKEKNYDKRVEALALVGLDVGLVLGFLGMSTAGAAFLFASLAPWLLYSVFPKVKSLTRRSLDFIDWLVTDRVVPPLSKFFEPLAHVGRAFRDKVIWPAEKGVFKVLVDLPLKAAGHALKPVSWVFRKLGVTRAVDKVEDIVADDVIGRMDKQFGRFDLWLTRIVRRCLAMLGAEVETEDSDEGDGCSEEVKLSEERKPTQEIPKTGDRSKVPLGSQPLMVS